jgi:hypothetical protein
VTAIASEVTSPFACLGSDDDDPLPSRRRRNTVQTVELTGKRWKALILVGALLTILGALLWCSGLGLLPGALLPNVNVSPDRAAQAFVTGLMLIIVGLVLYIVGRVGAWWYHG